MAAVALYMCFATIWGWWPTARAVRGSSTDAIPPSAAAQDPDVQDAASGPSMLALPSEATAGTPASLPPPPVAIQLRPDLDAAANRLRLGVLNRGELGRFRLEVIDAHNQDGNWVGPRSWPVPWLDDGSVTSKEIPKFGRPLLDFAHFDFWHSKRTWKGRSGYGVIIGSSRRCRSPLRSVIRLSGRGLA
jgi:hypothetical protein